MDGTMTATFTDGTEAAAREIEQSDAGLFGKPLLKELAAKVRALQPPDSGGAIATISTGIDAVWETFKDVYTEAHGMRNHWAAGRKAFDTAIKKRRHDPQAIITGTMAFVASRPDPNFVPMPATFLNQDRFLTNYGPPNGGGGGNLFDVAASLRG